MASPTRAEVSGPPMSLADLLQGVKVIETSGALATPIADIQSRLYKIQPGDLFAVVVDYYRDDHALIQKAISQGAAAILLSKPPDGPLPVPWVQTHDVGALLGHLCARRYGYPAERLEIVGVTGTNGKTTTTYLLESILVAGSRRPGRIGTLGLAYGGTWEAAEVLSTPEPPVLHRALAAMIQGGADMVTMEVTSQGISMGRVLDCRFAMRILTGIGHDHLDYHETVEHYAATKIDWVLGAQADHRERVVAPIDEPRAHQIFAKLGDRAASFGFSEEATVHPTALTFDERGIRGSLSTPAGRLDFASPLIGRHNLRNVMAAVAAAHFLDIPLAEIAEGLANLSAVPGRLEVIENDRDLTILVDFAHTPDALQAMLSSIRELARGRVIIVLGCGGDRDPTKRPIMAKIASDHAELAILTSDNSRSESPLQILSEMCKGLPDRRRCEAVVEPDRREAIRQALRWARAGDVVIIAGKGPEAVQIVGERLICFDDRHVTRELLRELS